MFNKPRSVERPESVKYRGKKMIETISSSFSVNLIANPPSRGTIIPATNAPAKICENYSLSIKQTLLPKIACTPIISVKKAEPNTRRIVAVMKNIVGPFSMDPVILASQANAQRPGKRRKIVYPTQTSKMYNAVRPDPAFTSATLRASNTQPTFATFRILETRGSDAHVLISFPTPADNTTIPTVVSRSLSSVRIRQRTGNAVMENATPTKSIKFVNFTFSSGVTNSLYLQNF